MLPRWTKFLMYPWRCSSRLVHWCSYHPNYKLCMSYHIIFVFDIGNLKSVAGFAMYQEIISLLIKHVNHMFYHTAAIYNVI
jgi:hypothetical protein